MWICFIGRVFIVKPHHNAKCEMVFELNWELVLQQQQQSGLINQKLKKKKKIEK